MKARLKVMPVVVVGAAALVLAGCSSDDASPTTASVTAGTAAPAGSSEQSDAPESMNPADDGLSAGFAAAARTETGTSPAGATWDFTVPQVTGGAAVPRDEFNAAMDGVADSLTVPAADAELTIRDHSLEPADASRTVVGRNTLSGVIVVNSYEQGAAHPSNVVDTVVVDATTGDIVTLDSLFTDPGAGRQKLVALAVAADPERFGDTNISPSELAQWIALDDGLHLYVPVIHARGDMAPVTIAWSDLDDQLTPAAQALFVTSS